MTGLTAEREAEIRRGVERQGRAGNWTSSIKKQRDLLAGLDEARQTNARLNRRCQEAEAVANENVEKVARAGWSLGRGLANYAASMYLRERDEARQERDALREALVDLAEADGIHKPTWANPWMRAQAALAASRPATPTEGSTDGD